MARIKGSRALPETPGHRILGLIGTQQLQFGWLLASKGKPFDMLLTLSEIAWYLPVWHLFSHLVARGLNSGIANVAAELHSKRNAGERLSQYHLVG